MSRRGRNVSYDNHRYHAEAMLSNTKNILSRGISPNLSRNEFYRENDSTPYSSGIYLKDKMTPKKQVRYIYKSSQNQKQIMKQSELQQMREEEYSLGPLEHPIGDLSVLKRKRNARRNYHRKTGIEKEQSTFGIIIKNSQQTRPQLIQKTEPTPLKKTEKEEMQSLVIEQLHYEMVKMQQRCKNAFRD